MISDAKIGCFLSGGIDSSIVSSVISENYKNLETYSLKFEGIYDESKYQKKMIDKFKFNSKHKRLNFNDFKKMINRFIYSMDQPTIDGFNTFFVSKLAKDNSVKVSFSGIGSDEIFYGYPIHKSTTTKRLIKILFKLFPNRLLPNRFKKIDYLKLKNDYGLYLSQRGIFSLKEISNLLSKDESIIIDYINSFVKDDLKKVIRFNYIDKMGFFELTKYMEGQLLRDSDIFGMSNSIEIRVPFLDKNLVQNVLPISYEKKILSNINKNMLVNKFEEILPKEIYSRKKQGFELPYKIWLKDSGIIDQIIKSNRKHKFLKYSHWSKIWALEILNNKY
jgi:asparagine synthase (glutamine-hydrolysing)